MYEDIKPRHLKTIDVQILRNVKRYKTKRTLQEFNYRSIKLVLLNYIFNLSIGIWKSFYCHFYGFGVIYTMLHNEHFFTILLWLSFWNVNTSKPISNELILYSLIQSHVVSQWRIWEVDSYMLYLFVWRVIKCLYFKV